MPDAPIAAGGQVGRSLPRLEARAKVTGRAEYVHGMRLPGMLTGKIFRSTVAHGRIRRIDVSAAKQVPGVYRVVTADDVREVIPDPYYGPAVPPPTPPSPCKRRPSRGAAAPPAPPRRGRGAAGGGGPGPRQGGGCRSRRR